MTRKLALLILALTLPFAGCDKIPGLKKKKPPVAEATPAPAPVAVAAPEPDPASAAPAKLSVDPHAEVVAISSRKLESCKARADEAGLEGVMGKRADAPYRGGRWRDWQKIRVERTGDFAIVGYSRGEGGRTPLGPLFGACGGIYPMLTARLTRQELDA